MGKTDISTPQELLKRILEALGIGGIMWETAPASELDSLSQFRQKAAELEEAWINHDTDAKKHLNDYLKGVKRVLSNPKYILQPENEEILPARALIAAFEEQIEAYKGITSDVLEAIPGKLKKLVITVDSAMAELHNLEQAGGSLDTTEIRNRLNDANSEADTLKGELKSEIEKLDAIWKSSPKSRFCRALSELSKLPEAKTQDEDVTSEVEARVKNNLEDYLGFQSLIADTKSQLGLT